MLVTGTGPAPGETAPDWMLKSIVGPNAFAGANGMRFDAAADLWGSFGPWRRDRSDQLQINAMEPFSPRGAAIQSPDILTLIRAELPMSPSSRTAESRNFSPMVILEGSTTSLGQTGSWSSRTGSSLTNAWRRVEFSKYFAMALSPE